MLILTGCGDESEETRESGYRILFPSTAVAVATDTVQVFVFDATNATEQQTDCLTLFTKRQTGAQLPDALVSTSPASPCEILGGGQGSIGAVDNGTRSFLVVTQRANADFFLGCALAEITAESPPVDIPLSPAKATVSVPDTECAELSQHCGGGC